MSFVKHLEIKTGSNLDKIVFISPQIDLRYVHSACGKIIKRNILTESSKALGETSGSLLKIRISTTEMYTKLHKI